MNSENSNETLTTDDLLDLLADSCRRRLLFVLLAHDSREDDDPQIPDDVVGDDEDVDDLSLQLRHVHLPKLGDFGIVEWDEERDVIRRGPKFETVRPALQLLRDDADELPDDLL